MKKQVSIFLFLIIGAVLSAQQPIDKYSPVFVQSPNSSGSVLNIADTITDYLDRATFYYTLENGSGGYILGTSGITQKTGCHYSSVGNARVTELMIYFGYKAVVGNADNITGAVYTTGADSMPVTLVASGTVNIGAVDVSGFPTFISVNSYPAMSGDFFVSVEYGSIDDTISIISTNPTTASGGPDGASQKRVRQQDMANTWQRAWDLWTVNSTPYDADALILPVMDIVSGAENSVSMNGFHLSAAYPSPASEMIRIPFSIDNTQDVMLSIFNAQGKKVLEKTYASCIAGQNQFEIETDHYASGTYFYVLRGASGQIASRFSVK